MCVTSYDEHEEECEKAVSKILTPELIAALKKKLNDELTPDMRQRKTAAQAFAEAAAHCLEKLGDDSQACAEEPVVMARARTCERFETEVETYRAAARLLREMASEVLP